MISPSSFAVRELKFLQKSIILTPCGPSAVPTGGAGVAFPAAIWSFTIACTFFAMIPCARCQLPASSCQLYATRVAGRGSVKLEAMQLQFFDLQKIQFDRRRTAEDGDHHLQGVAIEVDLVHGAVEAGERALVDADLIAFFEGVLRLGLLGRLR